MFRHVLACVGVSASMLPTWTAPCPAPVPSLPQILSLNRNGTLSMKSFYMSEMLS